MFFWRYGKSHRPWLSGGLFEARRRKLAGGLVAAVGRNVDDLSLLGGTERPAYSGQTTSRSEGRASMAAHVPISQHLGGKRSARQDSDIHHRKRREQHLRRVLTYDHLPGLTMTYGS